MFVTIYQTRNKEFLCFARYIFDNNSSQTRNSYPTEDIYTPPTPSAARRPNRQQQQQQQQHTPGPPSGFYSSSGGLNFTSGSALVVTGYVNDENHNHHEVKFVDISPGGGQSRDVNRSYARSRSHENRSADLLLSYPRSSDFERLAHSRQAWHHRSLDHLASYDQYNGNQNYSEPSTRQSQGPRYSPGLYATHHHRSNNQTGGVRSHLAHKPPAGQRSLPLPPPGQSQGHSEVAALSGVPRKLHWSLSAARRRTWSPPMFRKALGVGSSLATMRSYHSNDQLDAEENYYEDLDAVAGPPRLAPFSGKLDNKVRILAYSTNSFFFCQVTGCLQLRLLGEERKTLEGVVG